MYLRAQKRTRKAQNLPRKSGPSKNCKIEQTTHSDVNIRNSIDLCFGHPEKSKKNKTELTHQKKWKDESSNSFQITVVAD